MTKGTDNDLAYQAIRINDVMLLKTLTVQSDSVYEISAQDRFITNSSYPLEQMTLLHVAAYFNAIDCFVYLVNECESFSGKINNESAKFYTPFHYACMFNSFEVASYIFQYYSLNENLNVEELYQNDYTTQDETKAVIKMCMNVGSYDILKLLITKYNYSIEKASKNKPKMIIENCITDAIQNKYVKCLELIYSTLPISASHSDRTPLMTAIVYYDLQAVDLFLDGKINPAYKNSNDQTALSLACFLKYKDICLKILEYLDDPDIDPKYKAPAAIHWICGFGDPDVAEAVISKGINVNRTDDKGWYGLRYATFTKDNEDNYLKIFKMMKERQWDVNMNSSNCPCILAYLLTNIYQPPKLIEWLLYNEADLGLTIGNVANNSITIKEKFEKILKNPRGNREIKKIWCRFKEQKQREEEENIKELEKKKLKEKEQAEIEEKKKQKDQTKEIEKKKEEKEQTKEIEDNKKEKEEGPLKLSGSVGINLYNENFR